MLQFLKTWRKFVVVPALILLSSLIWILHDVTAAPSGCGHVGSAAVIACARLSYGPYGVTDRFEAKLSKYIDVAAPLPLTEPSRTLPMVFVLVVVRVCDETPLT